MDVPELERAEEVPVRSTQERSEHNERRPQDSEPEQENRNLGSALGERVIPVTLGVLVDIRNTDQPDDDEARQHDTRQPRIEVDEHLLQAEKVPGGLRRVRRVRRIGWLLERRFQED